MRQYMINSVRMKWSLIICNIYLGLCLAQYDEDVNKCNRLGGPGTYDKLMDAREKSRKCSNRAFKHYSSPFQRGIFEAMMNGTVDRVYSKSKQLMADTKNCMKDFIVIGRSCLTNEEQRFFNAMPPVLRRLEDTSIIDEVETMTNIGLRCLIARPLVLLKCLIDYSPCNDFLKYKNCIQGGLPKECYRVKEIYLTPLLRATMCKKQIRRRRSAKRVVRDLGGLGFHLPQVKNTIKEKCIENGGSGEKIEETLKNMITCRSKKQVFVTPKKEYLDHLNNCSKDTVTILKNCLPENLKYIPELIFDFINSLVVLLYDDYKEIDLGLGPCLGRLNGDKSKREYMECIKQTEKDHEFEIPTSKKNFCKKFISASHCFTKQLNETCERNDSLDKFSRDYTIAMEKPCKNAN